MSMHSDFHRHDVIVVGVGAMGSATIHHLARRGLSVLGLEQFDIPNDLGSSHGVNRIFRLAYYEGPAYVPLMNCILTVKRVHLKSESINGKVAKLTGRRLTAVTEVESSTSLKNVFSWDPHYDGYSDTLASSYQLPKIAHDTGLDMEDITNELERRKTILTWLVNRGTRDYRSISKVIGMFNQEPERLMGKVESS